jgi:hypothetical protein
MIVGMKRRPLSPAENLERSLGHPHPESIRLADLGFEEWCLAAGSDADGLVDESTGELARLRDAFQILRNEIEGKIDVRGLVKDRRRK